MTPTTQQAADDQAPPELKQVVGGLLFAAHKPVSVAELHEVLTQVDQNEQNARLFSRVQERDIRAAIEQVKSELAERKLGITLVEVAGRFRFQSDPAGGPWVRQLLNLDKPTRLSKPALETLAIIAYRQPITRAEIEAVRGVNIDAMMRHLLELQLVRITGRSELPGRPLQYGTTSLFLEHFGLSSVKNLPGIEQLSRREAERVGRGTDPASPGGYAGQATDLSRATRDDGPEKTEDGGRKTDDGQPAVALSGPVVSTVEPVEGAKVGQQKTDEANAQRQAPPERFAQASRMEERTEDGAAPDDQERKAEEEEDEEDEYDEDEDDEDADEEDEDDEGKEE